MWTETKTQQPLHISVIMGYDPYRLGGKPKKIIIQLSSKTSQCNSKEQYNKLIICVHLHSKDPVRRAPEDHNQDHLNHMLLWQSDRSKTGLERKYRTCIGTWHLPTRQGVMSSESYSKCTCYEE